MRIIIKWTFLFLLCLYSFSSAANDTAKTSSNTFPFTKYFSQNQFENSDSVFLIKNKLQGFSKYIPKNHLGNNGLAFNDLEYTSLLNTVGFNYYKNNYGYYLFTPKTLKFYNTRKPYTDLFYVIGTKREQMFKMTFSYNLKKNWNVSADFLRIRSEGVYLRQNTNDNCLSLSTNYRSYTNRYWVLSSLIFNSLKNAENGGIMDDSIFKIGGAVDKKLLDINLNSARRSVGNVNVFVKQIFNLGRSEVTDSNLRSVVNPGSRLILTSSFDGNYFNYFDSNPGSGYYSNIYIDSVNTNDSTFFATLNNELAWKRLDNGKKRGFKDLVGLGISGKHQLINVYQNSLDTLINNFIAGAEIFNTYSKNSFWWNVSGRYVVEGYNKNDYSLNIDVKQRVFDSLSFVRLSVESRLQRPDFIYQNFSSNNFSWTNNFDPIQKKSAAVSFYSNKLQLSSQLTYSVYSNISYFNEYALAQSYTGDLSVFKLSIEKNFSIYNWHLDNKVVYQKSPQSSVIRIPEFIFDHSFYYENDLFKKALNLQIGVSFFYTSSYYANAYMPVTGEFYLQNKNKYGNYPYFDFFIHAEIKTVRIFFKIDHLNNGFSGNHFMLTPDYPYPDRTFKFGVSWRFFD